MVGAISQKGMLYPLKVVWTGTVMCKMLCTCVSQTSPRNSAYNCILASLHFCRNIVISALLFIFCICSWEVTSLSQLSVDIVKCFSMWKIEYCCWHSTTASFPLPLQKLHTKCIFTYSSFENMLKHVMQHSTGTVAWTVYNQDLGYVMAVPACCTSPGLSNGL